MMNDIPIYKEIQGGVLDPYKNSIINNDCLSIMKQMPDKSIDAIITSPPYNLQWKQEKGGRWKNAPIKNGYEGYSDDLSYQEYCKWQKECLTEMTRLIKDDGVIFYNNKNRQQNGLLEDRGWDIVRGFPLRQVIIWQRAGGVNFNDGYFVPTTEQIYLICNRGFKLKPCMNKYGDVWKINQERNNPHPAPFPIELVDRILESINAQLVLDPFGGSGTTGVSCLKHNKNFILIEQSEKYCEMIKNRLEGKNWRDEKVVENNDFNFGGY